MHKLLQPNKKLVGIRIRAVKEELGASLTELGNRLGISKSTLNSYVRGYALAPKEIIEHLSRISGKSIEWFYYGEPWEYIRDYLLQKGHGALLEEFPNIPHDMENKYIEVYRDRLEEFPTAYPDEDIIDIYFSEDYDTVMRQYILRIAAEVMARHPDAPKERIEEIISLIGREVYDAFNVIGHFGYGDRDIIEKEVTSIYERKFRANTPDAIGLGDQYLVGTLISSLESDKKTTDVIRLLSRELTGKSFSPAFGGEKLVKIFQSMRPALIELFTQTTSDEFEDWFESE